MEAVDFVRFIREVNEETFDGETQYATAMYRKICEMFENQGVSSPFAISLSALRHRLQVLNRSRREHSLVCDIMEQYHRLGR